MSEEHQNAILGLRASHIVGFAPTLHLRLNVAKNLGDFFFHVFIRPLYERTAKVKCPKTMHIRLIMGLLEAWMAAFMELEDLINDITQKLHNRFDVMAFRRFFQTLMSVTIMYEGFLKAGEEKLYYDLAMPYAIKQALLTQRPNYLPLLLRKQNAYYYLRDSKHELYTLCSSLLPMNVEYGEVSVNLIAKKEMQEVHSAKEGVDAIKKKFAQRFDKSVKGIRQNFQGAPDHTSEFNERVMGNMVEVALDLIIEIVDRLDQADTDDALPRRVPKSSNERSSFFTEKFVCPTLTPEYTESKDGSKKYTSLFSHEVGADAYALFPQDDINMEGDSDAPDVLGKLTANGCNFFYITDCDGNDTRPLIMLPIDCGHSICTSCSEKLVKDGRTDGCVICVPEIAKRLFAKAEADRIAQQKRLEITDLTKDGVDVDASKHAGEDGDEDGENSVEFFEKSVETDAPALCETDIPALLTDLLTLDTPLGESKTSATRQDQKTKKVTEARAKLEKLANIQKKRTAIAIPPSPLRIIVATVVSSIAETAIAVVGAAATAVMTAVMGIGGQMEIEQPITEMIDDSSNKRAGDTIAEGRGLRTKRPKLIHSV